MKLIILASGRGSRLNKLTKNNPKCLVKVNHKTILSYLTNSFNLFEKIIIITGYRSKMIMNEIEQKKNIIYVKNHNYMRTNMVSSLFCASDFIDDDVVISYSDIIFDQSILKKLIKCKKTTMPLNYSWLSSWEKRMNKKDIFNDAEDVKVKNKQILSIGGKIEKNKLPKMQFMGLIKINKEDFFKMKKIFHKINNPKIDFTSFINTIINFHSFKIEYIKSNSFWTEIDSLSDLLAAEKMLKNIKKI